MSRDHPDEFDRSMRALHREAVAHVSPDVRQRLRAARAQAPAPTTRFGWPAASALAAALVVAVALPLRPPAPEAPHAISTMDARGDRTLAERSRGPSPASTALPAAGGETAVPTSLAALEESPDFYLWLASNDAGPDGALP